MQAKYIVFDGMDGSGKGTQISLLQEKLGDSVVFTREPGGPPIAEIMRGALRDHPDAKNSTPFFHFLGFWAAREEAQEKLIVPALNSGRHVFSDRGDSSTYAFQLHGEQRHELLGQFIEMRNQVFYAKGRCRPDHYIVFDLSAEIARERALRDAARDQNHFDERDLEYYKRVRQGFKAFAIDHPVTFIDASRTVAEVHAAVLKALASMGIGV